MKPWIMLRIAAIALATIIAGHSTTLIPREAKSMFESGVWKAMQTYTMPIMGSERSYWDFYQGMSIDLIIFLAIMVAVLWILSVQSKTSPSAVFPLAIAIFIGLVPFSIVCWTHFFLAPGIASTLAVIAMALSLPTFKRV
jgi:hypothetical protein